MSRKSNAKKRKSETLKVNTFLRIPCTLNQNNVDLIKIYLNSIYNEKQNQRAARRLLIRQFHKFKIHHIVGLTR